MTGWLKYAIGIVGGASLYAIGYEITKMIVESLREKRTAAKNTEKINLSGT